MSQQERLRPWLTRSAMAFCSQKAHLVSSEGQVHHHYDDTPALPIGLGVVSRKRHTVLSDKARCVAVSMNQEPTFYLTLYGIMVK